MANTEFGERMSRAALKLALCQHEELSPGHYRVYDEFGTACEVWHNSEQWLVRIRGREYVSADDAAFFATVLDHYASIPVDRP